MTSLKSLIPNLAQSLGMKQAAIYERQRALVRVGLLRLEPGRGPGSGVRATPESVAMLLISIAATASLSDVENHTKIVANLKSRKRAPNTGQSTFAAALADIFRNDALAKRAALFEVARGGGEFDANITFVKPDGFDEFGNGMSGDFNMFTSIAIGIDFYEMAKLLRESTK